MAVETPHLCPVCVGALTVPSTLYSGLPVLTRDSTPATEAGWDEPCRTCGGTGVLWGTGSQLQSAYVDACTERDMAEAHLKDLTENTIEGEVVGAVVDPDNTDRVILKVAIPKDAPPVEFGTTLLVPHAQEDAA